MLWFSLYDKDEYKGEENAFIDITSISGIQQLEEGHEMIYAELNAYLNNHVFENHFNKTMVENPASWKVRSLRVWGVEMYDVQQHFPKTMQLLNSIPDVVNVGFNLLEPQSDINPHSGDTNAIIRCHLGLKIPATQADCVIEVKNEEQHWQKGKAVGFMDAYTHQAWNHSNEKRIIMLFDILRPQFLNKKTTVCATVLASLYLQRIGNIFPAMYKIKRSIFKYIAFPLVVFLQVAIPLRNKLKK